MPLLLWPFPTTRVPPPPRITTGKVFILDSLHGFLFGTQPNIDEACTMIVNVGPGVPFSGAVQFIFTTPRGDTRFGDPDFAYVTDINIEQNFPVFPTSGLPKGQCLVYTFADGELNIAGRWSTFATVGGFKSATVTFTVNPGQLGVFASNS